MEIKTIKDKDCILIRIEDSSDLSWCDYDTLLTIIKAWDYNHILLEGNSGLIDSVISKLRIKGYKVYREVTDN